MRADIGVAAKCSKVVKRSSRAAIAEHSNMNQQDIVKWFCEVGGHRRL